MRTNFKHVSKRRKRNQIGLSSRWFAAVRKEEPLGKGSGVSKQSSASASFIEVGRGHNKQEKPQQDSSPGENHACETGKPQQAAMPNGEANLSAQGAPNHSVKTAEKTS